MWRNIIDIAITSISAFLFLSSLIYCQILCIPLPLTFSLYPYDSPALFTFQYLGRFISVPMYYYGVLHSILSLPIYLSVSLSLSLPIYLSIYLSSSISHPLSLSLSIYLSIYLYLFLSLTFCVFFYFFELDHSPVKSINLFSLLLLTS